MLLFKRTTDNSLQETVLSRRRPDLWTSIKRMKRNNQHDEFDDEIEILSDDMKVSTSTDNNSNDLIDQHIESNNVTDIYPTTLVFKETIINNSSDELIATKVNVVDIEILTTQRSYTSPTSTVNLVHISENNTNSVLPDILNKYDINSTISDTYTSNENYTNDLVTSTSQLSSTNNLLLLNNVEFNNVDNITIDPFLKLIVYEEHPKHIADVNQTNDVTNNSLTTINIIQSDDNDLISTVSSNIETLTNEILSPINDENTADKNANELGNYTILFDDVTTMSTGYSSEETNSASHAEHITKKSYNSYATSSTEENLMTTLIIIDSSQSEQNTTGTIYNFTTESSDTTGKDIFSVTDDNTGINQWENVTSEIMPSLSHENVTTSYHNDNTTIVIEDNSNNALNNDASTICDEDGKCLTIKHGTVDNDSFSNAALDFTTIYSKTDGNVTIITDTVLDNDDDNNENKKESNTILINTTIWTYKNETTVTTISDNFHDNISRTDNTTFINEIQNENDTSYNDFISTHYPNDNVRLENETDQIVAIEKQFSIKVSEIVQCDLTCQCTKKCPYGFDLMNDTCECSPPCEKYQCFDNHTCEVDSQEEPICLPLDKQDRPLECHQPMHVGYHESVPRYHDRWYYHPVEETCHHFIYRGSGGNKNNFRTLNDCRLKCITCAPAPNRGICNGFIQMWYYDYNKQTCLPFVHSGCKGNDNKFIREVDCIDTCVKRINITV
ncbi:unnamed protein product [Didymodactylos carnosus]|uniref:BPTI/Kunitz inhibitor domain-containing protein n=1 Tax=Didymodactylos carnosus TaxID=1234261 RepID=A0A813X2F8_9BILA|nr:unnamed protein product [Didymodactylos carnosus]CAF3654284.1 unnamed protein product [Didymodactylos carnosus]